MRTQSAPWLGSAIDLGVAVARRALLDVGICEDPPGSNRSTDIDEFLKRLGVPLGSPWCAAAVASWYDDVGLARPAGAGAARCETWRAWATEHNLWSPNPSIGAAVVYGTPEHAEHIGVVVRLTPLIMSVEGNTSLDNSPQREGVAVDFKKVNQGWRLGYVRAVTK